jgi:hypothetical protein
MEMTSKFSVTCCGALIEGALEPEMRGTVTVVHNGVESV